MRTNRESLHFLFALFTIYGKAKVSGTIVHSVSSERVEFANIKLVRSDSTLIENIDQWFDVFQDAHRDVSGYNDEPDPNYDWNWEEFIDLLGL